MRQSNVTSSICLSEVSSKQGAKKIIFTACFSGKLKLQPVAKRLETLYLIWTSRVPIRSSRFRPSLSLLKVGHNRRSCWNFRGTTLKAFWRAELISQFFSYSNSSKNITCPSGKFKTEFTSPIAKSTSPGLSDTTFFARCLKLFFFLVQHLVFLPLEAEGVRFRNPKIRYSVIL